jgi:predicted Fe-S protein YdhL (DUF1289 family)
MAKAKKLPGSIKGRITKLFKSGMLLPDIMAEIEPKFPKINIPRIKTVLRSHFLERCDILWAYAVKLEAGELCIIDRTRKSLNAHHLVGRGNYKFRWVVDNGVCLGCHRHTMSHEMAAHGSTSATERFAWWMRNHRTGQWATMKNRMLDTEKVKVDVYFLLETERQLLRQIKAFKSKPKPDLLARKKVAIPPQETE